MNDIAIVSPKKGSDRNGPRPWEQGGKVGVVPLTNKGHLRAEGVLQALNCVSHIPRREASTCTFLKQASSSTASPGRLLEQGGAHAHTHTHRPNSHLIFSSVSAGRVGGKATFQVGGSLTQGCTSKHPKTPQRASGN